jgi:uncharacterized membrane protein YkoI
MRPLFSILLLSFALLTSSFSMQANPDKVDKKQAIALATKTHAGKTLKVTEQSSHFIVRILQKDGRIIDLKVDKKTGKVEKD